MVIPPGYRPGDHSHMDNKAVRKANIQWLVTQHGGPTEFGRLIEREQVQVSQWLGGKPIGDRLARHIESRIGKPTGWLDQPQWFGAETRQPESRVARLDPETITITTRALLIFLRRRDPEATLDLTKPEDAELFAEVYAEAAESADALSLGAAVADLVQARGERGRGGEGESSGGPARVKAGRPGAGQ